MNWTQYLAAVWAVWIELAPWLLLGALIAGLMHGLLPANFIKRHLRGRSGVLKAVAIGVPMPLCSCGVIPTGLGLKRQGATEGAAVGFLISTPQTGVDSILVTASFLGWPFALFKVVAAALTGIVGGLLTDGLTPQSDHDQPAPQSHHEHKHSDLGHDHDHDHDHDQGEAHTHAPGWRGMLEHAVEMLQMIWGWLLVGVLLSAAITVLLPPGSMTGMTAYGGALAMAAALAISVPLYVCATASVPVAAALVAGGLPTGAALVFLMAGPATNMATIGAVRGALGWRATAAYLGTIIVGSAVLGMTFDFLLDGTAATQAAASHEHTHDAWWQVACALLLTGLILKFASQDALGWWSRRKVAIAIASSSSSQDNTHDHSHSHHHDHAPTVLDAPLTLAVEGMVCGNCTNRLQRVLNATDGVEAADVSLDDGGRVTVIGDISLEELRRVVEDTGFEPA